MKAFGAPLPTMMWLLEGERVQGFTVRGRTRLFTSVFLCNSFVKWILAPSETSAQKRSLGAWILHRMRDHLNVRRVVSIIVTPHWRIGARCLYWVLVVLVACIFKSRITTWSEVHLLLLFLLPGFAVTRTLFEGIVIKQARGRFLVFHLILSVNNRRWCLMLLTHIIVSLNLGVNCSVMEKCVCFDLASILKGGFPQIKSPKKRWLFTIVSSRAEGAPRCIVRIVAERAEFWITQRAKKLCILNFWARLGDVWKVMAESF
jgi:hypothetical protein